MIYPGCTNPFSGLPSAAVNLGEAAERAAAIHIVDGVDGAIFQLCQLSRGKRIKERRQIKLVRCGKEPLYLIKMCVWFHQSQDNTHERKRVAAGDPRRRPDFRDEKHRCCAPTAGACRTNCRRCRRTRVDLRPAVRTHHFFHVQPAQRPTTVTINYQHPESAGCAIACNASSPSTKGAPRKLTCSDRIVHS